MELPKVIRVYSVICFCCGHTDDYDPPRPMHTGRIACSACGKRMVGVITPDRQCDADVVIVKNGNEA